MIPYTLRQINTVEKRLLWVLLVILFVVVILYGYFVQATIYNIVERTNIREQSKQLNFNIGELESEYNLIKNKFTYDYAHSLGFWEPEKQIFATRKQLAENINF